MRGAKASKGWQVQRDLYRSYLWCSYYVHLYIVYTVNRNEIPNHDEATKLWSMSVVLSQYLAWFMARRFETLAINMILQIPLQ